MRPKVRGLAQHGGPPGCLEESNPAGVLYMMDGPFRLPFSYRTVALTRAAQMRADGMYICCNISKCTQSSVMS
jgi:hypothetical protein